MQSTSGRWPIVARIMLRIQQGWLPHAVGPPDRLSWYWGRPSNADGFDLWRRGMVPTMGAVERMDDAEVDVWKEALHDGVVFGPKEAVPRNRIPGRAIRR